MDIDVELWQSFTKKQRQLLADLMVECFKRGATSEMLAPVGALTYINFESDVTSEDIKRAKELAEHFNW